MAAQKYKIRLNIGGVDTYHESDDLAVLWKELGIGPQNISIKDVVGDGTRLTIAAKLAATLGDAVGDVAIRSEVIAVSGSVSSLSGTVAANTAAIAAETVNRTAADAAEAVSRAAADAVIQGQVTTNTTNISNLQIDLAAILANTPKQNKFTATANQTTFSATGGLTWDAANGVYDIEVFIDGRRQTQDPNGLTVESYKKTSTTQIVLNAGQLAGKEVVIWKQGTSSGSGGGGGGTGLTAGAPANAFYLLDQTNMSTVWKLTVDNGVLGIVAV